MAWTHPYYYYTYMYILMHKKREEKVSPSTKVYELKFKASILPANPKTCYTPMAHCISLGAISLTTLHDCYRMIQLIMRGVVKRSVHDGHCVCVIDHPTAISGSYL